MAFHRVNLRMTVNSFMDDAVVTEALEWLTFPDVEIQRDRATSYHGSSFHVLHIELTKKKEIRQFFENVKVFLIEDILDQLEQRIDEQNVVHFRIDAEQLMKKTIHAQRNKTQHVLKCEAKLAVFPQQNPIEIFREYILSE